MGRGNPLDSYCSILCYSKIHNSCYLNGDANVTWNISANRPVSNEKFYKALGPHSPKQFMDYRVLTPWAVRNTQIGEDLYVYSEDTMLRAVRRGELMNGLKKVVNAIRKLNMGIINCRMFLIPLNHVVRSKSNE